MSDIKLDGNQVKIEAWDLLLDHADRRRKKGGFRRALVHDFEDGLTLNWAEDYPGGVTVQGELKTNTIKLGSQIIVPITFDGNEILAPSELSKKKLQSLFLSSAMKIKSTDKKAKTRKTDAKKAIHTFKDGMGIAVEAVPGKKITRFTMNVDLVKMVCQMAEDIEELRKQIKTLQNS